MPDSTPIDPRWLARKAPANAREGDRLILGKPLGLPLYRAAQAVGILMPHDLTRLQQDKPQGEESARLLACLDGVHALVPVENISFVDALWSLCQASHLRASLQLDHIPVLPSAPAFAEAGLAEADWHWAGHDSKHCWLAPKGQPLPRAWQGVLSMPEQGGGLLVSCSPDAVTEVLSLFLQQDFNHAAVIGTLKPRSRHRRQVVLH